MTARLQFDHISDLTDFICEKVDEYFEQMNSSSIENPKKTMVMIISDMRDEYSVENRKPVFKHYLGVACEFSDEYWKFKYDILKDYYNAIGEILKLIIR